jgi:hypothetical protein
MPLVERAAAATPAPARAPAQPEIRSPEAPPANAPRF